MSDNQQDRNRPVAGEQQGASQNGGTDRQDQASGQHSQRRRRRPGNRNRQQQPADQPQATTSRGDNRQGGEASRRQGRPSGQQGGNRQGGGQGRGGQSGNRPGDSQGGGRPGGGRQGDSQRQAQSDRSTNRQGNQQPPRNAPSNRRGPVPQGHRRPLRDEEIEPRLEPTRFRPAPNAPGAGRGEGHGRPPGQQRILGGHRAAQEAARAAAGETASQGKPGSPGQQGGRSGQAGPAGSRQRGQGQPGAHQAQGGQRRQPGNAGPRSGRPSDHRGRALALETSQSAPTGKLRVAPLGGVGEVGKNMTMVEYEKDIILLDSGGKFPEEEQRGIDLIVPDVSYVRNHLRNLRGILITHGHEDHIGGLPYILPQLADAAPIPIYGSPLAIGLIERKLEEHRLEKMVKLIAVEPGTEYPFGKLSAEFIHVTHSIPDTNAIAVHSPVGTIVDTADFKFDPTPVMGGPTDERRLRQLGEEGVLALFSDTVRVEVNGSTPSERVVMETIDEVIGEARGMVVIATFASNISRIHMALRAAERYGRKVAVAGRSMEQSSQVARDLGYLDPPDGLLMPLDEVLRLPRNQRVLVITGSQGEASAALARIAAGEHPKVRLTKGDVALLSATPIPGNEETVTRTIDNLFRRGARVVYSTRDRGVHVSGHAGRDELLRMIELLKPKFVVPIHGEFRHMMLYRELAGEAGISPDHVLLPEIGGVIEFTKDLASQRSRIPAGSLLVDRLGDRGGVYRLRERNHLFDDGVVVVTLVVDRETGELIAGPDLVARDLKPDLANGALREAEVELRRSLQRRRKGEVQIGHLIQRTKESVGKVLYRRSSDKTWPMILPVVTEL